MFGLFTQCEISVSLFDTSVSLILDENTAVNRANLWTEPASDTFIRIDKRLTPVIPNNSLVASITAGDITQPAPDAEFWIDMCSHWDMMWQFVMFYESGKSSPNDLLEACEPFAFHPTAEPVLQLSYDAKAMLHGTRTDLNSCRSEQQELQGIAPVVNTAHPCNG